MNKHGDNSVGAVEKEIRVLGLRRSGNHAFINWLREQVEGKSVFANNLSPFLHPFYNASKNEHIQLGHLDVFLHSYEDILPAYLSRKRVFARNHDIKSKQKIDIIILRDPFNLFASRHISDRKGVKSKFISLQDLWIIHAKEFLGDTNELENKVCVNYNEWASSKDYRKLLADQLGLTFNDQTMDSVARMGGGSSFDGVVFDGKASEMKVQERWKKFVHDPEYLAYFSNKQLLDLSNNIFGQPEELDQFINDKLRPKIKSSPSIKRNVYQAVNNLLMPLKYAYFRW